MAEFKQIKQKMKTYKPAIYDLGVCYFEGRGVKENKKKAFKCFLKAAKKFKNVSAYEKLVECYTNGFGCKIDKQKAGEYKQKINNYFSGLKQKPLPKQFSKNPAKQQISVFDSSMNKFLKQTTIMACPNCGQHTIVVETTVEGKLEDEYLRVYKNVSAENDRLVYECSSPSLQGETKTEKFECKSCGVAFLKQTNVKIEENIKKETKHKIYTIKYVPIKKCDVLVEKVLSQSSGTFKEKC